MLSVSLSLLLIACAGTRSATLGAPEGKLAPCPKSPNCVSSQARDAAHAIAPLTYTGPASAAMDRLARIIEALPRARIIVRDTDYLHAEFTSVLLRFVDDVEVVVDAAAQQIHVRSASRVGYSDLGVNRRRVETIRAKFNENADPSPGS